MKAKKIFITLIIVVATVLVAILLVPQILSRDSFGLKKSGSLYENMSNFAKL